MSTGGRLLAERARPAKVESRQVVSQAVFPSFTEVSGLSKQ
jgi:hypothetical protein